MTKTPRPVFDAAHAAGIKRMLLVTTIGAGDSYGVAPLPARRFLRDMIPLRTQAKIISLQLGSITPFPGPVDCKSDPATDLALLERKPGNVRHH